jgi:hypothetical protein
VKRTVAQQFGLPGGLENFVKTAKMNEFSVAHAKNGLLITTFTESIV